MRWSDAAPENVTPMVVGGSDAPAEASVRDDGARVVLETGAMQREIAKKPLALRPRDHSGRRLASLGGRERNHWNRWDSLNTVQMASVFRAGLEGRSARR